uniref:Uncharacterized protein n=1 Tax=viral metagenome TaxID=1070528 RepID=A0A6C0AD68_9ZZZZ
MKIKFQDIPQWLENSELYRNFSENENKKIEIPDDSYKKSDKIKNMDDFKLVFNTCKYWNLDEYPNSFYKWALKNKNEALRIMYQEPEDLKTNDLIEKLTLSYKMKYKLIPFIDLNYTNKIFVIIKFSEKNYFTLKVVNKYKNDINVKFLKSLIETEKLENISIRSTQLKKLYTNISGESLPNQIIFKLELTKFNIFDIQKKLKECFEEIDDIFQSETKFLEYEEVYEQYKEFTN